MDYVTVPTTPDGVFDETTDSVSEPETAQSTPNRRQLLRALGIGTGGLLVGLSPGGVAVATQERAGRPELMVSSPSCEVIELEYLTGKAPLTVYLYGPGGGRYAVVQVTAGSPSMTLTDVPVGTYSVEAKPGDEFDDDTENSGVVVTGSPVTVESCIQSVQADFGCVQPNGARLTLTNPNDVSVNVHMDVFGGLNKVNEFHYVVAGGESKPVSPLFSATGFFSFELTATLDNGGSVPVNGESTYREENLVCSG